MVPGLVRFRAEGESGAGGRRVPARAMRWVSCLPSYQTCLEKGFHRRHSRHRRAIFEKNRPARGEKRMPGGPKRELFREIPGAMERPSGCLKSRSTKI